MEFRLIKLVMVLGIALQMWLVSIGNVADPEVNWEYIKHILSMDLVEGEGYKTRAILNESFQKIAYISIIILEFASAILCTAGSFLMFLNIRKDDSRGRQIAGYGLLVVIFLFFVCFYVVGGEYFQMWRAKGWDARQVAMWNLTTALLTAVALKIPDKRI
ncbi:hypothetical protein FUAX_30390 [Fulvitalea axinellae]|uniref:DUF2165 domain-containing protein n=1 Tax=Fulvitalea axinellae TaxID=1182444 RepID=A0AAU9CU75_9BACT|nr:hypothetical protein FUAX_30390 [Fulvitalea axinellae]